MHFVQWKTQKVHLTQAKFALLDRNSSTFSSKLWFLPLYESFMRGEEDEEEEDDEEEEEDAEELRVTVAEEAWAAARPSRNRELQVTIMATIIIIMVIILARLEQTQSFQKK